MKKAKLFLATVLASAALASAAHADVAIVSSLGWVFNGQMQHTGVGWYELIYGGVTVCAGFSEGTQFHGYHDGFRWHYGFECYGLDYGGGYEGPGYYIRD